MSTKRHSVTFKHIPTQVRGVLFVLVLGSSSRGAHTNVFLSVLGYYVGAPIKWSPPYMYTHISVCMYVCMCIHTHIYIYAMKVWTCSCTKIPFWPGRRDLTTLVELIPSCLVLELQKMADSPQAPSSPPRKTFKFNTMGVSPRGSASKRR